MKTISLALLTLLTFSNAAFSCSLFLTTNASDELRILMKGTDCEDKKLDSERFMEKECVQLLLREDLDDNEVKIERACESKFNISTERSSKVR
tara:strand:- start:6160 stop:6438 length:279 start_codon:yes stop_codon:yes gene_type:complete